MVWTKVKEALISVLPIAVVVVVLSLTLTPLSAKTIISFVMGCALVIAGMSLFSIGSDVAMIPIGEMVGSSITKTRKLPIVICISLLIGIIITIAEPDLSVLATSLGSMVNKWVLIILVAVGVGIFLVLAMLRVVFGISLRLLLVISYSVVFILAMILSILGKTSFLPLAFDSGGVTTGPMTVPFIIAMGMGVAEISGKSSTDNSFGFVALASVGPIIAAMLLGLFANGNNVQISSTISDGSLLNIFLSALASQAKEMAIAIGPIALFFLVFRLLTARNMPVFAFWRIVFGLIYTYVGLVLFMTGAHAGFSMAGQAIGEALGANARYLLVPLGIIIGFMIVGAEPAVHVLNGQVEKISGGTIKKFNVLLTLMCGVAISVGLAMLRLIYTFSIWWLILPGYAVCITLSFIVPKTYTAIAFDSGGVASGPMTTTFLLPLAMGACGAINGQQAILGYAYGVVAMVAMTPIIAVQILGAIVMLKEKKVALSAAKQPTAEIISLDSVSADTAPQTDITTDVDTQSSDAQAKEVDIIDLD